VPFFFEGMDLRTGTLQEDMYTSCIEYTFGAFDNIICFTEEAASDSFIMTIDDVPCDSCTFVTCDDGFDEDISVDCTNALPDGGKPHVFNFCNADVPKTSPLIAYGDNELYFFEECFERFFTASSSPGTMNPSVGLSTAPSMMPTGTPSSGGFRTSLHTLLVVMGMAFASTLW